jgi:hypothetical protein
MRSSLGLLYGLLLKNRTDLAMNMPAKMFNIESVAGRLFKQAVLIQNTASLRDIRHLVLSFA